MERSIDNLQFPHHSGVTAETRHSPSDSDLASLHPSRSGPWRSLPIKAFSDGFFGGLVGGIAYNYASAWLQFGELQFSAATVLVLATILGAFEVWRVARVRPPALVRARMLVLVVACVVVLLTVTALSAALSSSSLEELNPLPVAPHAIFLC